MGTVVPASFTPYCPMGELRKASLMPLSGCTLDARHAGDSPVPAYNHDSADRLVLLDNARRSSTAAASPLPPTSAYWHRCSHSTIDSGRNPMCNTSTFHTWLACRRTSGFPGLRENNCSPG